MKRVVISLVVVACFFVVVGCSSPTGLGGNQPIFLCDPTITIAYSGGVPGQVMMFAVTVDTNVYSLYEDLIDEVDLIFGYEIDASVWNMTQSRNESWNLNYGVPETSVSDPDTPYASYNIGLHPDGTSISPGDTILMTITATVTVTYDTSSQRYSLYETFTHTF